MTRCPGRRQDVAGSRVRHPLTTSRRHGGQELLNQMESNLPGWRGASDCHSMLVHGVRGLQDRVV